MEAITTTATSSGLSHDTLTAAIRREHTAASMAAQSALQHALEAGRLLAEAKATIPHGSWESYVRDSCGIAPRTASLYQRLHRHRDRLPIRQHAAELSLRRAVKLLEQPKATAETVAALPDVADTQGDDLRLQVPEWYRAGLHIFGYHSPSNCHFETWPTGHGEPWVHVAVWVPDNFGSWSHCEGTKRGIRFDHLGRFLDDRLIRGIPKFDDKGWDFWYEPTTKEDVEKSYNRHLFDSHDDYLRRGLGIEPKRKARVRA